MAINLNIRLRTRGALSYRLYVPFSVPRKSLFRSRIVRRIFSTIQSARSRFVKPSTIVGDGTSATVNYNWRLFPSATRAFDGKRTKNNESRIEKRVSIGRNDRRTFLYYPPRPIIALVSTRGGLILFYQRKASRRKCN